MADDRSLADLLWDYTVYAPIGLAISIAEELPKLSEKGRDRFAPRFHLARVVGRFTVGEAQRRVGRVIEDGSRPPTRSTTVARDATVTAAAAGVAAGAAADSPITLTSSTNRSSNGTRGGRAAVLTQGTNDASVAIKGGPASPPVPEGPAASAPTAASATAAAPAVASVTVPTPAAASVTVAAPAVASLAIPGYDTLAASHVVKRLSSLRPDELDAIRSYEIATRGRRTILHRIAQLAADR